MQTNQKNSMGWELMGRGLKLKEENAENIFKMLAFVAFCCVLGYRYACIQFCGLPSFLMHLLFIPYNEMRK